MGIRDDNKAIAEEAGLGYEVYSPYHVVNMASSTGDSWTVLAVVEAENGTMQSFVGFYSAEEAPEVAARVSRMRKFKVYGVFTIDPNTLVRY